MIKETTYTKLSNSSNSFNKLCSFKIYVSSTNVIILRHKNKNLTWFFKFILCYSLFNDKIKRHLINLVLELGARRAFRLLSRTPFINFNVLSKYKFKLAFNLNQKFFDCAFCKLIKSFN